METNILTPLTELITEGTWRAMEWFSGERTNAVMQTLEKENVSDSELPQGGGTGRH